MNVKTFVFNSFQLNTYLLYDDLGEGIIIDAGNHSSEENEQLFDFVEQENISIRALYYTHAHIDHIAGNNAILQKYRIQAASHRDSIDFFMSSAKYASNYGFDVQEYILPTIFLNDGDIIHFGKSTLKALHTPGHADGSLCYYAEEDQFVIVGDVLFKGSIGRTDLPSGDFDLLQKSILEKLFVLPNGTKVYPGHGPSTTIGFEKINNPFVNLL